MIAPEPPIPNSYWVYAGQLLAGEYPGAPRLELARNRVQRLLAVGIDFFVDLTMPDELPPYAPVLPAGIQHVRLAIYDHDVPEKPAEMLEILGTIRRALQSGRRVYVHCRAGIGRTGTVIGCFLIEEKRLSGDDALSELNRLWQACERSVNWSAIPETADQVEYVRRWTPQLTVEHNARTESPVARPLTKGSGPARTLSPRLPRGSVPRESSSKEMPSREAPARDIAGRASTGRPAPGREVSARDIPGLEVPPRDVAAQGNDEYVPFIATPGLIQPGARHIRDRFLGALIGLAIGDALGTTTQQQVRGAFEPITDLVGGGPFDLPRGAWTDDTAMALCLAESLLESRGFDARDQVERYARWQQSGYLSATGTAVGVTPNTARSIAVAQWRRQLFAGSHDPKLVEPSPLTRMAPSAMFYLPFRQQALEFAGDSVRTTCQAPLVLNVCRLFAAMVHAALEGQPKAQVLSPAWDLPADRPKSRIRGILESRYRLKDPSIIHAGDHVLDTLEMAVWAFDRTDSFAEGALLVANGAENSDVAGAVYGQLAGAYYGIDAIPVSWRNVLIRKDIIASLALRLLEQTKIETDD